MSNAVHEAAIGILEGLIARIRSGEESTTVCFDMGRTPIHRDGVVVGFAKGPRTTTMSFRAPVAGFTICVTEDEPEKAPTYKLVRRAG